jgi:hypothetical protein
LSIAAVSLNGHVLDAQLFVAWLDKKTQALLDVFVMNFDTHVIYDYAPGSLKPE